MKKIKLEKIVNVALATNWNKTSLCLSTKIKLKWKFKNQIKMNKNK